MNLRKINHDKTPIYKLNKLIGDRNELLKERNENSDKFDLKNIAIKNTILEMFEPIAKYKKVRLAITIHADRRVVEFSLRLKERQGRYDFRRATLTMFHDDLILTDVMTSKSHNKIRAKLMDYIDYYKQFKGLVEPATQVSKEDNLVVVSLVCKTKYFK